MSASETKQRVSDYHAFLTLAYGVSNDHSPGSDRFRILLNEVSTFLQSASNRELRERGKTLMELLSQAVCAHEKVLRRKGDAHEIGRDFKILVNTEPDVWRYGIPMGWLQERFDISRLPHAEDLPQHARIGIGVHAGFASVEEVTLLGDAFFLLVRARESLKTMIAWAEQFGLHTNPHKRDGGYRTGSALNSAICTYSRLGVLTAAAFVEAFVNSVGWSEATSRSGLTQEERLELQGMRKDRYLMLEAKLERFPRIIRADKRSPIILSDEKQRREPFISFLNETKEIRDSSMHYAPDKAPIIRPPQEWVELLEAALVHAVGVSREFWAACYPGRHQPRYLARLEYEGLLREALDRLANIESASMREEDAAHERR